MKNPLAQISFTLKKHRRDHSPTAHNQTATNGSMEVMLSLGPGRISARVLSRHDVVECTFFLRHDRRPGLHKLSATSPYQSRGVFKADMLLFCFSGLLSQRVDPHDFYYGGVRNPDEQRVNCSLGHGAPELEDKISVHVYDAGHVCTKLERCG